MNEILRRRRALMGAQSGTAPILPNEYQQVEWIGSNTEDTRIQTAFVFDYDDNLHLVFSRTQRYNYYRDVLYASGTGCECYIRMYGATPYGDWFSNGATQQAKIGDSYWVGTDNAVIITYETGDGKFSVSNGTTTVTKNYPTKSGDDVGAACLFGKPDTTDKGLIGKLMELSVMRNGKTVFYGFPCYRKADDVIGLYEAVSKTFYTATAGMLTKGADV